MKTLVVITALVAAVAAFPQDNVVAQEGQFVLIKDFSVEDGTEYSVKYVKPYKPGQRMPLFDRRMDSSEEVYHYLASQQARGLRTWADRVRSLRQLLSSGVDVSDERYHRMYSTGAINFPSDRQYYVDSSGEIYYDAGQQTKFRSGTGVEAARK